MAKKKRWKPGQIVTINGVVYRVKRAYPIYNNCTICAFNDGFICRWPQKRDYQIQFDCHFERLSPSPRGQF